MVLLDEVLDYAPERLKAGLTVRADSRFFVPGHGVPAHVGIEYMAQACGAYAGLEALALGQPVRLGFLLGTRSFQASAPWFTEGAQLVVTAAPIFREGQMAVFDCEIHDTAGNRATARLTVFQPEDATAFRGVEAEGI